MAVFVQHRRMTGRAGQAGQAKLSSKAAYKLPCPAARYRLSRLAIPRRPRSNPEACPSPPCCHMGDLTERLRGLTRSDTSRPPSSSIHSVIHVVCIRLQYCVESRLICNLGDPVISPPIVYVYVNCQIVSSPVSCPNRTQSGSTPAPALANSGSACWPSRPRQPEAHCPRTLHWQLCSHVGS